MSEHKPTAAELLAVVTDLRERNLSQEQLIETQSETIRRQAELIRKLRRQVSQRVSAAWTCTECGQRNSAWATECGRCKTTINVPTGDEA